jgi:hypothetical protein
MSDRKIVDYFIASANDADSLQDKVLGLMEKGFQPLGSVCFQRDSYLDSWKNRSCEWYFQQTMVKYDNNSTY